jgi:DNA invertase Pin-like site-specific DNA recombinase
MSDSSSVTLSGDLVPVPPPCGSKKTISRKLQRQRQAARKADKRAGKQVPLTLHQINKDRNRKLQDLKKQVDKMNSIYSHVHYHINYNTLTIYLDY